MNELSELLGDEKEIDIKKAIEVKSIIGYSHKSTYRIFNNACYEFAQKLSLVTDIDLLEYKE